MSELLSVVVMPGYGSDNVRVNGVANRLTTYAPNHEFTIPFPYPPELTDIGIGWPEDDKNRQIAEEYVTDVVQAARRAAGLVVVNEQEGEFYSMRYQKNFVITNAVGRVTAAALLRLESLPVAGKRMPVYTTCAKPTLQPARGPYPDLFGATQATLNLLQAEVLDQDLMGLWPRLYARRRDN